MNPSLSEGFGLPLLEATYLGCPVIASNIPVFREILNDDFLQFDPTDVSDIIQKLEQAVRPTFHPTVATLNPEMNFDTMTQKTVEAYIRILQTIS